MSSASPPKPWERAGGSNASTTAAIPTSSTTPTSTAASNTPSPSTAPAIPERPSALSNVVNRTASSYSVPTTNTASTFANRPYGSTGYGYNSYNSFSSPYSRFGAGYGGYGGGMYGGGPYGAGFGQPGDPNDPNNSLTNNFAQSTQATFQIIESIVGAFGGFAQMLESTYMATHSSFFAMVSVAEQFGNLRQTIGSVLGIYAIIRWIRTLIAKLTGRPPPADATSLTPSNFFAFTGATPPQIGPDGRPLPATPPRPSKKPFIVFLLAVFGLPYLMGKLIRALARNQEEMFQQQQQQGQIPGQVQIGPDGQPKPNTIDASKLDFCRVLYDFPPPEAVASGNFNTGIDLEVKKGDLVAVLNKSLPSGESEANTPLESQWWRCRARDGRLGYLPAVYLETIQRRPVAQIANGPANVSSSTPGSRSNTMPASVKANGSKPAIEASTSLPTSRAHTISSQNSTNTAVEEAARQVGATRAPDFRTSSLKKNDAAKVPVTAAIPKTSLENMQRSWVNER